MIKRIDRYAFRAVEETSSMLCGHWSAFYFPWGTKYVLYFRTVLKGSFCNVEVLRHVRRIEYFLLTVFGKNRWKVKQSHYRPGQALRLPGVWGSQISGQSAHDGGKFVSRTHRPPLPPPPPPREIFLVLISVSGWVNTRGIVRPGRIMAMKNSSDTIGSRTRDHLVCSAVPQPTPSEFGTSVHKSAFLELSFNYANIPNRLIECVLNNRKLHICVLLSKGIKVIVITLHGCVECWPLPDVLSTFVCIYRHETRLTKCKERSQITVICTYVHGLDFQI
jgi:hypothetical protein